MASDSFADRLMASVKEKNSRVCVGLDPRPDDLPECVAPEDGRPGPVVEAVVRFCARVLFATAQYAAAVKLQAAFFEQLGMAGMVAFFRLAEAARDHGLITIADVKRCDIGSTAEAYAEAYLACGSGGPAFDAVTVTPYLGSDSVAPFLGQVAEWGRGLFVVVRASNPSAAELQDLRLEDGRLVHEAVADLVVDWGEELVGDSGYSSVGAVVGATAREHLAALRARMPSQPFLVPGYGAQGGTAEDVVEVFDEVGLGAVVNSSRGIMYAYKGEPYAERYGPDGFAAAAGAAARDMRDAINGALEAAGKLP